MSLHVGNLWVQPQIMAPVDSSLAQRFGMDRRSKRISSPVKKQTAAAQYGVRRHERLVTH